MAKTKKAKKTETAVTETKEIQKVMVSLANTNDEIREALIKVGIKPSDVWSRDILIRKCEEEKIWIQQRRSVVPESFKVKYGPEQNCGDDIAELMKDLDVGVVAKDNGIDLARWAGKNPGMIRMNLGNVLRGRARRGEYVKVGEAEYNTPAKV